MLEVVLNQDEGSTKFASNRGVGAWVTVIYAFDEKILEKIFKK